MLSTLGKLTIEESEFARQKPLLLLCYLAIEGPQARRVLADLFFFDAKNPRDALSTTFRRLKGLSEALVLAKGDQIETSIRCDTNELLKELDASDYKAALKRYQGAFLLGLDLSLGEELEEWVFTTREYLAAKMCDAQLSFSESLLTERSFGEAAKLAEKAIELKGATGLEPDDYIRAYRILSLTKSPKASSLKTEAETYGIVVGDYSNYTNHLDYLDDANNAAAITSSNNKTIPIPNNLIQPHSSFIGRDPELLEIARLVTEPHVKLLTLHAPGGMGKTRLALQAAFEQVREAEFKDGVYFVPLDAISDGEQIPLAIASALGLTLDGQQEPLKQLKTHLENLTILLVLDNYEHLIDWTMLVSELIGSCVNLKIIVTSRECLNLAEEHVLPLRGLSLPADDSSMETALYSDALLLLVERAKKTKLDFELTADLFPQAVKFCQLLEGLPLGIELAMSWVRVMPFAEILSEVEKNLEFLESTTRNSVKRHQSIKAVFEHSWLLLSKKEQIALQKLALFKGGFRREEASAVASTTLAMLVKFVDKSLIHILPNSRYYMHNLLFQFTLEKLSETPQLQVATQRLHLASYSHFIQEASSQLRGSEQLFWLSRIEEEYENLSVALAFGLRDESSSLELGLEIAASLGPFWEMRGRLLEGRTWLNTYLKDPRALTKTKLHAKVLNNAAWLAFLQGDYSEANLLDKKSLVISQDLDDKQGIGNSLTGLGVYASDKGDYESAKKYFEQCLRLNQELEDQQGIASLMNNLGILHSHLADYRISEDYHKQSLVIRKELGDERGVGFSLNNLGLLAFVQDDFESAQSYFSEGLVIKRSLGDMHGIDAALDKLGSITTQLSQYEKAQLYFSEAMRSMLEIGDRRGIANCLQNIASLRAFEGEYNLAVLFWGKAEAIREEIDFLLNAESFAASVQECLGMAQNKLGEEAFLEVWSKGRALSIDEIVVLISDSFQVNMIESQGIKDN